MYKLASNNSNPYEYNTMLWALLAKKIQINLRYDIIFPEHAKKKV